MTKRNCPVCSKNNEMPEVLGVKHCRECLKKAFDLVKDPKNWKNPIAVFMEPDAWYMVAGIFAEAIEFFTATKASCSLVDTGYGYKMLVEAPGYYNGPAN